MGKPRWVRLHDGYKSMMSIPRWAFVIEKMCDGQIADGEYSGNRESLLQKRKVQAHIGSQPLCAVAQEIQDY